MAKRADSKYLSGARTDNWLKIKTSKRQEVVIAGFTAPKADAAVLRSSVLALREGNGWRYIGHVGTALAMTCSKSCMASCIKLKTASRLSARKRRMRPLRPG